MDTDDADHAKVPHEHGQRDVVHRHVVRLQHLAVGTEIKKVYYQVTGIVQEKELVYRGVYHIYI